MSSKQNKKLLNGNKLLDQTANDFEDDPLIFRFPKKQIQNQTNNAKRRGRSKKTPSHQPGAENSSRHSLLSKSSSQKKKTTASLEEPISSFKEAVETSPYFIVSDISSNEDSIDNEQPLCPSTSQGEDLVELEKSVCSSSEKLCPSCKHIVLVEEFCTHLSKCVQRFSFAKKDASIGNNEKLLPCPVCLKAFHSAVEKRSHIKTCATNQGLSTEQLILATRLQEKQEEERVALGLPSPQVLREEREASRPKLGSRKGKKTDADLELAFALSRSLAEDEKNKREREEDKLMSLGLHDVIQEKRRKLVLPQPPPLPLSGRGVKGKRKKEAKKTVLMTRTKEERERIITEKVAEILVGEVMIPLRCVENRPLPTRLPAPFDCYEDKETPLWNFAGAGAEVPMEAYFVSDISEFIKPRIVPVGTLLKSYSQIPGRLNFTTLAEDSDGDVGEDAIIEENEATIVDEYCTQLALAEMLNTQELNDFTFDAESCVDELELKDDAADDKGAADYSEHRIEVVIGNDENEIGNKSEHVKDHDVDNDNSIQIAVNNDENSNEREVKESITPDRDSILPEDPNRDVLLVDLASEDGCSLPPGSFSPSRSFHQNNDDEKTEFDNKDELSSSKFVSSTKKQSPLSVIRTLPPSSSPRKNTQSSSSSLHSKLIYDWSCLLANGDYSDITIVTAECEIPVHVLVLSVRCPEILKDVTTENPKSENQSSRKKWIDWTNVAHESAYAFMVYIYSGTCTINSKENKAWLGLFDLAIKYACSELMEYLEQIYKLSSPIKENKKLDDETETSFALGNSEDLPAEVISVEAPKNMALRTLSHSIRSEAVLSHPTSPDIFADWSDDEHSKEFIATPTVTPLGVNIRESILKSLNSPVLDISKTIIENNISPAYAETNTASLAKLNGETGSEGTSKAKSVFRRNLSNKFKKLNPSPLNERNESSSHSDENVESPMDPLSPFPDFNYPSDGEIVDLTMSSDNSISEGVDVSPSKNPIASPQQTDEILTNVFLGSEQRNCNVISPLQKSSTLFLNKDNSYKPSLDISSLIENPLRNSRTHEMSCEITTDLVMRNSKYCSAEKQNSLNGKENLSEQSTESSFHSNVLKSKDILSNANKSNSPTIIPVKFQSSNQSLSDDSLIKAVCSLEDEITVQGTTRPNSTVGFRKPQVKFYKSKSCNNAGSLFTPDKENAKMGPSPMKRAFNITPMPDYKSMLSPELKGELDKYGIRKLSRKKAVTLLLHIYEQMHPVVTDSEAETSSAETPNRVHSPPLYPVAARSNSSVTERRTLKKRGGREKVSRRAKSPAVDLNSSQTSNTSAESCFDCLEETVLPDSQDEGDAVTPTQQTSLENRIAIFIRSDVELHTKILCYEPIWANELRDDLKANGIKCSLVKLIEYLDEQCITFRLPSNRNRKRVRKYSPGKSPRKRKKRS